MRRGACGRPLSSNNCVCVSTSLTHVSCCCLVWRTGPVAFDRSLFQDKGPLAPRGGGGAGLSVGVGRGHPAASSAVNDAGARTTLGGPPRDLSTKAEVRITSRARLDWLRESLLRDRAAAAAARHVGKGRSVPPSGDEEALHAALLTFVYPPPGEVAATSASATTPRTPRTPRETEQAAVALAASRDRWRAAFVAAYDGVRFGGREACQMMLYVEPEFEVAFTASGGACGRSKPAASVSGTSLAMRKTLAREGVKVAMPLAPQKKAAAAGDSDEDERERETLRDWCAASAALASGSRRVHALFNYLLERGAERLSRGQSAPLVLAPCLFAGACLHATPVRIARAQLSTGSGEAHVAQVSSVYPTPPWVWMRLAQALRSAAEVGDFDMYFRARHGAGGANVPLHATAKEAAVRDNETDDGWAAPWDDAPTVAAPVTSCKPTSDGGWEFITS